MLDVTRILSEIESGDSSAAEKLLPIVYEELRKLAAQRMVHESPDHTLQATALVHEAYLRLVNGSEPQQWNGRGHFFAAAAEAMRRILINRARDKGRTKRGGSFRRVDLEKIAVAVATADTDLLAIDEAIETLAGEDPQCAAVVKLRFFAGLSIEETASALNISASTAKRHWTYARAWLFDALQRDDSNSFS